MKRGEIVTPKGERFRVRIVDWSKKREKMANVVANSPNICGDFTADALGIITDIKEDFPDLAESLLMDDLFESLEASILAGDDGLCDGLMDPDDIPTDVDPVCKRGEMWRLGAHRLLCGDSSNADDVDRLLKDAPVHLVNTDPPYNVRVEPRSNNAIAAGLTSFARRADLQCGRYTSERGKKDRARLRKKTATHHQRFDLARRSGAAIPNTKQMRAKDRPLENDFIPDEEFDKLLRAWFTNIHRVLIPGGAFYIWGGYANCANYPPALKECELYFSQSIIWVKEHPVLTRKDFMGNHEWCFYGWKKGKAHRWYGPNNATDVWSVKKINPQSMVHLTEKPVELAQRALEYSSKKGENVLDLFGGSGSTLMACETMGRNAYLMELDPAYCDVIIKRWEDFSGRKAEKLK
jgi:DNA modification methylase